MTRWVSGNEFSLLENGEAFFPRVFSSIAAAQHEVILQTAVTAARQPAAGHGRGQLAADVGRDVYPAAAAH